MKRASILIAFFFWLPLCIGGIALQSGYDLFQKALVLERADGKLQEAIALYQKVVNESQDESLAAKAQLQIGICYEKLGQHDARAAYQKVIDNYPQQQQEVASARERMARLVAASMEDRSKPTFRKIHLPNTITADAQFSPDGKSLALPNWNDGTLWIMPMSSNLGPGYPGAPRQLDTQGVEADNYGFTWSGDGKWIAFNGKEVKEGRKKIYVVPAAGGKPREIHENNRGGFVVHYRMSLSPHGETIAFSQMDAGVFHIYKKSVAGGLPERLVNTLAKEPVFSPDGKMIAYVEDKNGGTGGGRLWVIPAEGGTPTLVDDSGIAWNPIWSPDGRMLAFIDYAATKKIHIVQLGTGATHTGEKISIDCPEGMGAMVRLTGWTPDNKIGAIFQTPVEYALYAQPVEGAKTAFVAHGRFAGQPRWSPDGKRIFHVTNADNTSGDWQRYAIAYVPAEGGEVKTVPLQLETKINIWAYGAGIRVSPDGRNIVFAGQKPQDGEQTMHIWTLPSNGGTPTQLTDAPFRDWYPCWSPDGRNIAFVRVTPHENWAVLGRANIFIVPAEGGEPRQISSESDRVFPGSPVLWSPDGKLLTYISRDKDDAEDGTLKVIQANGGEPRVVAKVQGILAQREMAWSPDGRRIAFNARTGDSKIMIVSLEDGSIKEIVPDLKDVSMIYHLDWSPDGKTLVFAGLTGGGPELWMMEGFLPLVKR